MLSTAPMSRWAYELGGHAALFQGDYKIVYNRGPLGDDQWRLFNIVRIPERVVDLAGDMPQRLQRMLSAYERYTRENGVLPIPQAMTIASKRCSICCTRSLQTPLLVLLLTILFILPFYVAFRLKRI